MPKQLNPLPPTAISARRLLWAEALVVVVVAALIVATHHGIRSFVPGLVSDDVYRTAVGLAVFALALALMATLMRRQWRWLRWLIQAVQVASLVVLLWLLLQQFPWYVTLPTMILPVMVLVSLSNKVTKRWFNK